MPVFRAVVHNFIFTDPRITPPSCIYHPRDASLAFKLPSESSVASGEEEFDFESTLQILAPTKAVEVMTCFHHDTYYVEAKQSTVSSVVQIPLWMYGVLVVLGWNEAMTVLFNPLYLVVLIEALGAV
jgi:protein SEY1